ncbi:hypothetical protein [Aliidongia dinghuensis]|uniref:hypothetical protein n=1 Tax=Aliidongia dinghuensis TaxID=1867774 RepID=UPI001E3961BD|nr:hypothetical protein [Aliidongia dinghuensis]
MAEDAQEMKRAGVFRILGNEGPISGFGRIELARAMPGDRRSQQLIQIGHSRTSRTSRRTLKFLVGSQPSGIDFLQAKAIRIIGNRRRAANRSSELVAADASIGKSRLGGEGQIR